MVGLCLENWPKFQIFILVGKVVLFEGFYFKFYNASIKSIFKIKIPIDMLCQVYHSITLRFLVFPFFIFQVLQMSLHFKYCMPNILINTIISNVIQKQS